MEPKHSNLQRSLGRIEGKIDGLLNEQKRQAAYTTELSLRQDVLTTRVSKTENTLGKLLGWAAGVGVTGGATGAGAFTLLSKLIGG
jgi:hypothetical protein